MAELVGGNRRLEIAMCRALLECFSIIEGVSWHAIEALGGADCEPGELEAGRKSLVEIASYLIRARGVCEEIASIMGVLLYSTEQVPLSSKDSEAIASLEKHLRALADEGGLRAACGEFRNSRG